MRAGDNNLLILTFYIIGISYTINRMIESIDDKINFSFDKASVDEQLKKQEIFDDVGISFKLSPTSGLEDLKELLMFVENKSKNLAVYVDWDNSSIVIKHNKQSMRVIRKSPDITRDLAVSQSPGLVAPEKTLTTTITSENTFERDKETGTYNTKKPIVDIKGLEKNPVKANRILFKKFMNEEITLEFSLQLVLRLSEVRVGLAPGQNKPPMCIVNCPFIIKKLPWTYALPWNQKRK
ncbi:hypothetical protein [Calothrix sp. UHCC 0171]|uniref:hypothetical protein n=1 Tax=Calothrix sp. UHCC 0171 TaxID=3110245 RepID=UPI002B1FF7CD|nr:hypothetical protein [Calothrix sp. UHCC 0171]MEA5570703.1 hypothetical protein [Calothrix sp. UHCC 0171]